MTDEYETIDYDEVLLPIKDVRRRSGLSTSAIYRRMDAGSFPRPLQLGGGIVRWKQSELVAWMRSLEPSAAAHEEASAPAGSHREEGLTTLEQALVDARDGRRGYTPLQPRRRARERA